MNHIILDTNVIIRLITADDRIKQEKTVRLFEKIKRALQLFVRHDVDFEDALIAAYAEKEENEIFSFDSDFEKIPSITYKKPS